MNIITKLMYSLHRILGTLLCILFLMWFLSAFVMMYHRFPRVSAKEKLQKQELLSASGDSLPDITSVLSRLPKGEKVRKLTLDRSLGKQSSISVPTKEYMNFTWIHRTPCR